MSNTSEQLCAAPAQGGLGADRGCPERWEAPHALGWLPRLLLTAEVRPAPLPSFVPRPLGFGRSKPLSPRGKALLRTPGEAEAKGRLLSRDLGLFLPF